MFLIGATILIYSVEELIENISKAAILTGTSSFFLAVIFAGMDFENWAFGVASALRDLPGVAIGSAFGSAIFLIGVAVAIAGILTPFETKPSKDYLLLMLIAPIIVLPFLLTKTLTRIDGAILLGTFLGIIYYLYRKETKGRETFRDEETEEAVEEIKEENHSKWYYLGLSTIFVIGIVIGSELAVRGTKNIITIFNLNGTIFGMTFVGLIMSLEEVLLVVEPVRKNRESIAVGNIIGSLIFFSTGNIGLIAIAKQITLDPITLNLYWPILLIATTIITIYLYRGKIKKPEGITLAALYTIFWIISYI